MNRSRGASYKRYLEAKKLIDAGKNMRETLNQVKLGSANYYKFKNAEPKEKRLYNKKKSSPVFIDLKREPVTLVNETVPTPTVAIIVCAPNQITQVLQNLRG